MMVYDSDEVQSLSTLETSGQTPETQPPSYFSTAKCILCERTLRIWLMQKNKLFNSRKGFTETTIIPINIK